MVSDGGIPERWLRLLMANGCSGLYGRRQRDIQGCLIKTREATKDIQKQPIMFTNGILIKHYVGRLICTRAEILDMAEVSIGEVPRKQLKKYTLGALLINLKIYGNDRSFDLPGSLLVVNQTIWRKNKHNTSTFLGYAKM